MNTICRHKERRRLAKGKRIAVLTTIIADSRERARERSQNGVMPV